MSNTENNTHNINVANEISFYLSDLKREYRISEVSAYEDAKSALERTGVTTKNGNTKKKIVPWE